MAKKEEKNPLYDLITKDEYGILNFGIIQEDALIDNYRRFTYLDIFNTDLNKSDIDLSDIKKYYRVYQLWKFICSNTSERIIQELDEDYRDDEKINSQIESMLKDILFNYFFEKSKSTYPDELAPYIDYRDEILRCYNKLRELFDECKKGNKGLIFKTQKEIEEEQIDDEDKEDLIDIFFKDEYRDEARAFFKPIGSFIREISEACAMDNLANRINNLTYDIRKYNDLLESMLQFSNPKMQSVLRYNISDYLEVNYDSIIEEQFEGEFTKKDYLDLIKSICKLRKVMPGTISVVISEIVRIAKENGIELDDTFIHSFEVPEDLADHAEYIENCEPVHVYRI